MPQSRQILRTLHKHSGNIAMQELLSENNGRIRTFIPGKLFHIGDMNIIPFFVDHSAYHANMFLFESKATGHTVLHSGDFRGTGYMSKSLDIIPQLIHDSYREQVDVLLTEGTMMTRSPKGEHLLSEWDVNKEAKKFMKDHRQIFVVCSSTNFDSLTSFCHAAQANNIPIYGSPYIIEMLKIFSSLAGEYTGLYRLPPVKGIDEMKRAHPKEGVVLLGSLLNRKKEDAYSLYNRYGHYMSDYKPHLIYSMWQGYLNPKHQAYLGLGLAAVVRTTVHEEAKKIFQSIDEQISMQHDDWLQAHSVYFVSFANSETYGEVICMGAKLLKSRCVSADSGVFSGDAGKYVKI